MKLLRWAIYSGAIVIFLVMGVAVFKHFVSYSISTQVGEPPRLTSLEYDFGFASRNQIVHHDFRVANPFGVSLDIIRVKTSCSCTVVGTTPATIAAHSSATIPVEVHLGDYNDTFRQEVLVEFKDYSAIRLAVTGKIIRPAPDFVDFGMMKRGEGVTRVVYVRATRQNQIHLISMDTDPTLFAITPTESAGPEGKDILLSIRALANGASGTFARTLRLVTDDIQSPQVIIDLRGEIAGVLQVEKTVNFGAVSKELTKRDLHFTTPYGGELALKSIDCGSPYLSSDLKNLQKAGNEYILPITIDPAFPGQILQAQILVDANVSGTSVNTRIDAYAIHTQPTTIPVGPH
jgi:hypothetical protein